MSTIHVRITDPGKGRATCPCGWVINQFRYEDSTVTASHLRRSLRESAQYHNNHQHGGDYTVAIEYYKENT